jgi:hypothetical protein
MEETSEYFCVICWESILEEELTLTACVHVFHTECIDWWMDESNTCPVCRSKDPLNQGEARQHIGKNLSGTIKRIGWILGTGVAAMATFVLMKK